MTKTTKTTKKDEKLAELTADLQRVRADFENYRKRVEAEKDSARQAGVDKTVQDILPIIDTIDRAVTHIPGEISDNAWVKGVAGLSKQLTSQLDKISVSRMDATVGVTFDPELHQAVQFDEDSEGETEIIAEELQPGYKLHDRVLRHAMVKVSRK